MIDQAFQIWRERQREIKKEALKVTLFKNGLSIRDKKARFPGFCQRKVNYKAGQVVESGAMPLPVDIVMHESVSMVLEDGTKLYSDIFLPSKFQDLDSKVESDSTVPALIAWSPYSKQKGTTLLDDFPMRAGVSKHWLSGLQKWEGPDPAYWCARGYAIVNVDVRGAYCSEGDLYMFGHQEAEDGAQFVTWVSNQAWCNGKVGMTGNSWLACAQWRIGSLRPEGLAALAPWEGFNDYYRHHMYAGGIRFTGFHEDVIKNFTTQGKLEDISQYAKGSELRDSYWEDKTAHPEQINVPTYVVASWTNPVHTPGTLKAWASLPSNIPKWLRVHNSMEWPDYYDDNSQRDLQRFFDYYLKSETSNGWEYTPQVRLSVLNFGLVDRVDTVNRPEAMFPLSRTQNTRYYLQHDNTLSLRPDETATAVSYDSASSEQVFQYRIPQACETTGYFMAHLVMSCPSHSDMDVFVQAGKLSSARYKQAVMCIRPQSAVVRQLLKFMHDWGIGLGGAGMAMHWGPDGQLRASHAPGKNEEKSTEAEPFYKYKEKVPLKKGEVRALDIPMRPYGMYWEKGDILQLTVKGSMVVPFPIPGLAMHETDNKGLHVIHCGGNGENSSYLSVPHV